MKTPLLYLRVIGCTLLLLPVLTEHVSAAEPNTCALEKAESESLLSLPFKEFDQQQDGGWRPLYEKKCYAQAAALLIAYIEHHPDVAQQQYILPFHAGQMLALAGQYDKAAEYMRRGYSKVPSKRVDWNAFVDANLAFLQRDYTALLKQRDRIDQQPVLTEGPGVPKWAVGTKLNLKVVDGLISCFEDSYETAYRECGERSGDQK